MIHRAVFDYQKGASMFETIKKRWRTYTLGNESINKKDNCYIADKLNKINETAEKLYKSINFEKDDLWDDLEKGTTASMTASYIRISKMALAYGTYGTNLYKNESLKAVILKALEWMYNNRYGEKEIKNKGWRDITAYNWWDWAVGAPQFLMNTLLIMEEEIEHKKICDYLNKFDHGVPKVVDYGANRFDFAMLISIAGLLQGNEDKIRYAIGECENLFLLCDNGENDGQGFYSDGTYIFHTRHTMNGTYGFAFLSKAVNFAILLNGSEFAFSDEKKKRLVEWFIKGIIPFVNYGVFSRMVCGREPDLVEEKAKSAVILAMSVMELVDEDEKKKIAGFVNEQLKYIPVDALVERMGIKYISDLIKPEEDSREDRCSKVYYFADKVVHKRPSYTFTISMSSSRIYNYECINNQNMNGWYVSDGMTCLYNENNRYSREYWKNVNPYYIPGTTVDSQERQEVSIRQSNEYLSGEDFVGGCVYDDLYSTVSMNLESYHSEGKFSDNDLFKDQPEEYGGKPPKHTCSLKAKKTWFLFDDELVCMGTGITSSDNSHVRTVILNGKHNITKGDGYFVADNFGCVVLKNTDYEIKDFGEYKAVSVEHGVNPDNAGYIYTIYPGKYDLPEDNIEILSNTEAVSAVYHKKLGINGYVFREKCDFSGVKVSDSIILMISENKISACDPTHKNRVIYVGYKGKEYKFDFSGTNGKTITAEI